MDRRHFLKNSALLGAAVASCNVIPAFGAEPDAAKKSKNQGQIVKKGTTVPLSVKGSVIEPAREIPVIDSADVVILGGGPAGVAAAVCAARQGADVMLLERQFYLGGLWTGGCVLPVIDTVGLGRNGKREQAIFGIMSEITGRLAKMGMLTKRGEHPVPDPEAAKYVLEEIIQEAGVRMLYNCQGANVMMNGDSIDCLIVETKSGRVAIKAKTFIDCSGDGDMLDWTGEDFEVRPHHIGAMWRYGNAQNFQSNRMTPIEGVKYAHYRGEEDQNGLDVYNVTRMQLKIRKHIWNKLEEARETPGCEKMFVLDSGTIPGVRVTRVMNAVYNLDFAKSFNYTKYDDCIGLSGGDVTVNYGPDKIPGKNRPVWQMPYRSLTPKRVSNLLVAGRCIGYDLEMVYDAREVGTCFVSGQAAGTAAAMCANTRCSVRDVDVKKLQALLKKQNVRLE